MQRYLCRTCKRTFGVLTGTRLSGLHRKEVWLTFGDCLADGDTVKASAERCGVAVSTAFRWRHRFLEVIKSSAGKLRGIVEADETFVLASRKGDQTWKRAKEGKSAQPIARPASGAARRPSAACPTSKCRSWWRRIVPARPSARCCRRSRPTPSTRFWRRCWTRTPYWSPTAAPAIRHAPPPWVSATRCSTSRPASAPVANSTSRP